MSFLNFFAQKNHPRIRIKYGRLIDPIFTFYSQHSPDVAQFGWNDWTPPAREELDRRIKAYKEEWKKYTIVKDLCKTLDLTFERNIIDVYIVSGISRASSDPIIIKSGFKPKEFVVTLAHELIHVLLTENRVKRVVFDEKESKTVNEHVPTYAVLKKILNDELWAIEAKKSEGHRTNEYRLALEIMEKIGAENVIKMLKASEKYR